MRRIGLTVALSVAVTACSGDSGPTVGELGFVEGFAGVVASDEPRAALIGSNVLSAGGAAADAAVAMAFTMAVTLPSSVGLGGGGVCVAHDPEQNIVEAIDFLPRAQGFDGSILNTSTAAAVSAGGGAVAVPGFVRGLYALHARYGALRWSSLLTEAEGLARFGHPVSRALARRAQAAPDAAQRFVSSLATVTLSQTGPSSDGAFTPQPFASLAEGVWLEQLDLAHVIGAVRVKGAADFYTGPLAAEIDNAARLAGLSLSRTALRDALPRFTETIQVERGDELVHFAPVPASSAQAAQAFGGAGAAGAAAYAAAIAPVEASAGFVVADAYGGGVACSFTMGQPFGTGIVVPGKGFLTAPASAAEGVGQGLVPILAINSNVQEFHAALSINGAGADRIGADLARATLVTRLGDTPPQAIPAARRFADQGGPGGAHMNMALCPGGVPPRPSLCTVAVDPRGAGFGQIVGQ